MQHRRRFSSAFTLVELSIVLVILGLLVGGVLTGQSLIRAAELRSVTTQYNNYVAAAHTFRDKYFAIPGDMTNAQSFWGVAHATPATCATTVGTGTQTCNGNGNGYVETSAAGANESYRFWQQLANAGLVEGSYSGITQGSTAWSSTTANSPPGKMSSTTWFVNYWGALSGLSYLFNASYDNSLLFGGIRANADPGGAVLKPEEVWNIDSKMDDGKPGTGKVLVYATGNLPACTDTSLPASTNANYLLNSTALSCTIIFPRVF